MEIVNEPNWKGKKLNYDATLAQFAEQIDIPLWKAMAMMQYAGHVSNKLQHEREG